MRLLLKEVKKYRPRRCRLAAGLELALAAAIVRLNGVKHGGGQRHLRVVVTRRILLPFRPRALGHADNLGDAINKVDSKALAARGRGPEKAVRARVVEDHPERFRELTCRIAHEQNEFGPGNTLVLGPSFHHRTIVHTEDNDLIDPEVLELVSVLAVARNLAVGSGGCESARQAHEDDLLTHDAFGDVDVLRRETMVQHSGRKRVADLDLGDREEREQQSPHEWRVVSCES